MLRVYNFSYNKGCVWQKQEDHKFKGNLSDLIRSCLRIKKSWGCSLVQKPQMQLPVLKTKQNTPRK